MSGRMEISDRVHGSVHVTEPLLVELIESPALQRMKGISVAGYFTPWLPNDTRNRFEHSVGVMHALGQFGASLEEQAAGLIHDVSHGTFSHCLDYVLADASLTQDHQDNIQDSFVREKTNIPAICAKYGMSADQVLDDARHPLKEQPLPDLCADRIDYSLRDAVGCGVIPAEEARRLFSGLSVEEGRWILKDASIGRAFAESFRATNRSWWSDFPTAIMFRTVADYLRHALSKKYVVVDDLYTTDAEALAKINAHLAEDSQLADLWKRMNDPEGWKNDPSHPEAKIVCKSRMVDPLVRHEGKVVRLSTIQPDWGDIVKAEGKPRDWFPVYTR